MRLAPVIAVGLALVAAGPAPGQEELPRLRAEQRDHAARARRLAADAEAARARAVRADAELARAFTAAADDPSLAGQRSRLRSLAAREAALLPALARERGRQARLLGALQTLSRAPPPPLATSAKRTTDTIRAARLMQALAPELKRRADRLERQRAAIAQERRLVILSAGALIASDSEGAERRARLEAEAASAQGRAAVLAAEADRARRAAATLERRILALGGRPAPPTEAETAAALPAGRDRLTPPLPGAPEAVFSRDNPGWRWSTVGEDAAAPAVGRVLYAGELQGWGAVVILDLGPGWRAVIAGFDRLAVREGQTVADGQPLGRTAPDGRLSFELRLDDRPIDPAPWLE